jgi:hypothetical protein
MEEFKYIKVPNSISLAEFEANDYCLAPSKYSRFRPNEFVTYKTLDELITESKKKIAFNKTKLYQYSEIGDIDVSNGFVSDNSFYGIDLPSENPKELKQGDIVISTVRTYRGGIGIITENHKNHCCTPAMLVIRSVSNEITKEYLYSILRTEYFIEQILGFQNRGMYPRLDKEAMKHILIPIPKNKLVIDYISKLTKAYINKVVKIRKTHYQILETVKKEIFENQKQEEFNYSYPTISQLERHSRLDATFHSETHHALMFPALNYKNGFAPLTEQGMELKPGPSLEIKILEIRVDSEKYVKGFYRLITPKQILNYGIIDKEQFIGTPKRIPTIQFGDILFGESGTGRTMVYLEKDNNTINNAHAHILRPNEGECSLEKAITIRCIMQYYKEIGIIDCLTVGGNGGHLSPSYFDRVYIPNFPDDKQREISLLYHNPSSKYQADTFTLENFLENDNAFNETAGIYELDKTAKQLKEILNKAIDDIANDIEVNINFNL